MLKGSLSPYLDTHNEEESSYVTLSNGPYPYVADSASTKHNSYNHVFVDVYFVTPILCKHCEDYIWGNGKVGIKCQGKTFYHHYTIRYIIAAVHFSFVSGILYYTIFYNAKNICNAQAGLATCIIAIAKSPQRYLNILRTENNSHRFLSVVVRLTGGILIVSVA